MNETQQQIERTKLLIDKFEGDESATIYRNKLIEHLSDLEKKLVENPVPTTGRDDVHQGGCSTHANGRQDDPEVVPSKQNP